MGVATFKQKLSGLGTAGAEVELVSLVVVEVVHSEQVSASVTVSIRVEMTVLTSPGTVTVRPCQYLYEYDRNVGTH